MNKHIVNKNISAVAFICLSAHAMDVNDQEDPSRKRDRPVSAETTDELPHKKLKGDGKDSEEEASALFKTHSISGNYSTRLGIELRQ